MRKESWLRRIAPSWLAITIYAIIALAMLLIGSYRNWVGSIIDPDIEASIVNDITSRASQLITLVIDNSGLSATVVSFFFWLVVAAIAYMVAWTVLVAVKDILNEIEISLLFVHPRSFTESKHWSSFLIHYLLKIAALLMLIGYLALAVYVLWPAILAQVSFGLSALTLNSVLLQVLPALLLSILALHVFVLLFQLLFWKRSADYWRQRVGPERNN